MVLWLLTLLLLLDVGLRFSGGFGAPTLNDSPRVAAMQKFLAGSSQPNVVVLGSSLSFAANYYCDTKYATDISSKNIADSMTYLNACYFQEALSKLQGKEIAVANLSIPGGMAEDAYAITRRLIQSGKRPDVVIYEVAPRDLVDNLVPVGCGALSGALDPAASDQRSLFSAWDNSSLALEWKRGLNRLGKNPTSAAVHDFYIACVWQFYKCRSELKDNLIVFACKTFGRQPTLYAAAVESGKPKLNQVSQNSLCHDASLDQEISNYFARYNPPNYQQFVEQGTALKKLAKLCGDEKIRFLVVNMPITDSNKVLIDADLYRAYRQELTNLTKSYECKFIDADSSDVFHQDDFKDTVHLNTRGGRKFQDTLVQKLASESIL